MTMAEKIKMLRASKGLTLEQIGDYVGVGKSTVRKWENGIIENMRRDKIAKLASILGTTPDYLMGWEKGTDEWTRSFCDSLSHELMTIDASDAEAALADIKRFSDVAAGNIPISLAEACSIADTLGLSLDEMVGNNKAASIDGSGITSTDKEIINLLLGLSDGKRSEAIHYLRFLSERSDK